MKNLVISLLFLLNIIPNTNINFAKASFDGRAYDSSLMMDFSDLSKQEISQYYTYNSSDVSYSLEDDDSKGEEFKTKLYNIISQNNYFIDYGSGDKGVNQWYKITDRNWELSREITPETYKFADDKVEGDSTNFYLNLLYFGDNSSKEKAINNYVNGFKVDSSLTKIDYKNKKKPNINIQEDKEHVWAKSNGFGGDPIPNAGTDLHHLIAADHYTNSSGHNDLDYGEVADKSSSKVINCYYADGSYEISGYRGKNKDGIEVFEPTDQYKGDIARATFYMATRYSKQENNSQKEPYLVITDDNSIDDENDKYKGVVHNLSDLLKWNELDTVSDYEIHRNNLIYNNVQRNRNPFIDHPEWVNRIFDKNYTSSIEINLKEKYETYVDETISLDVVIPNDLKDNVTIVKDSDFDEYVELSEDYKTIKIKKFKKDPLKLTFNVKDPTTNKVNDYLTTIYIKEKPTITTDTNIPNELKLFITNTYQLTLPSLDIYQTDSLYYKVEDESIVSISSNNELKALKFGKTKVNLYLKTANEDILLKSIDIDVNFNSILLPNNRTLLYIAIGVFIAIIIILILIIVFVSKSKKKKLAKKAISKAKKEYKKYNKNKDK